MSFIKIGSQNLETVSLLLRPQVHFISSSIGEGVTGSQYVSPVRSPALKQVFDPEDLSEDRFSRLTTLENAMAKVVNSETNILDIMSSYLLGDSIKDVRYDKSLDVFKFNPPFKFNKNTTEKNVIRKTLMPFHAHKYDNCGFWYTNYNTLNFFDNNHIPTGSALLYPSVDEKYHLPDNFTVSFWLNPRYSRSDRAYNAGTILHISSSICISLVSGSSVDEFGTADKFKILLQLSQSADVPPSSINLSSPSGAYPRDLIFTSSNYLSKNHWHNVFIAWSNSYNNSTGSMFIDDIETNFYIPSSSVSVDKVNLSPPCLILGNYYDGTFSNLGKLVPDQSLDKTSANTEEGYPKIGNPVPDRAFSLTSQELRHPLNAEIHDIRLYNKFINKNLPKNVDIAKKSPTTLGDMIFYVPVYFYPSSSNRDIIVTPFQKSLGTSAEPFNVNFSFGVGGKENNLENYTLDFVNMAQPRLIGLVPQTVDNTVTNITADEFTYNTGSNTKRLLSILPNDNGLHQPIYDILENSGVSFSNLFKKSGRAADYSIISLEDLIPTASIFTGLSSTTGSILNQIVGPSPDNLKSAGGSVLSIAQRTRDVSSNEITILDISNIYYGSKIHPKTLHLYEENLTGSNGDIKINLKDNGRGGIYRADCLTPQAEWNNVGSILYEEGIAVIKSPNLPYFGKDKLDMKLRGEQFLNTLVLNVPVNLGEFMSSSNKTFKSYPPDNFPHNENLSTIHITSINIHDDNFNVIMKAQFAQPITKTEEDEFIIRLKQDF